MIKLFKRNFPLENNCKFFENIFKELKIGTKVLFLGFKNADNMFLLKVAIAVNLNPDFANSCFVGAYFKLNSLEEVVIVFGFKLIEKAE
jgi:hypothetical protein